MNIYENTEYMNINEVAEFLKVPRTWIYKHTMKGCKNKIPHYKLGKYLRFVPREVSEWVQEFKRGWRE